MAQRLRALTALPEVLSSIPSNHMVAHNYLEWDLMPSSGVSEQQCTHVHKINNSRTFKKKKQTISFSNFTLKLLIMFSQTVKEEKESTLL